ncbi:BnaA07g04630D [Brassica napus]|uniref:BnaA07g04630D protein n=1 Tax=Brassica napus TaxID=3708 RepID=A0A078GTB8_BRANA|nr:BnaA07g04630D [Brassica napus]
MFGRSALHRAGGFRPENLGQNALNLIGNIGFSLFVVGVLVFTIIAATYEPEDPLFHPSDKITTFLTSTSNATLRSDESVVKTGEDFMPVNQTAFAAFINITDVEATASEENELDCDASVPVDCKDSDVFHLMMKATIERFKDIHFYKFGKPAVGEGANSCDMAWRYRPKDGKSAAFYKDYRRFVIHKSDNCTLSVATIGEYHSGLNARKRKRNQKAAVNDSLPTVESDKAFTSGKYLVYVGGGDRCKSMNHFLWSFLCALGEAQYLNRTLVMDLTLCLSSVYTSSGQSEEGKDFRFYFDFEHLKEAASVLDEAQFWAEWGKLHNKKTRLGLHLVEDFRVTPMKLSDVKDTLIMRKFGSVEPDNYWYRVCEGDAESVVKRPWHLLWKSRRLMEIVSAIASRLNWDYDAVHIERGEKARNTELWPNLEKDTSPKGRNLYIATNEAELSFFNPLKDKYATHFLDEYKDLWDESSEWYSETTKLNGGNPVEFDGYMRASVDTEVFLRGKKQIETFNELTNDCKDGVGTCNVAAT